jgi:uncharacterized protein
LPNVRALHLNGVSELTSYRTGICSFIRNEAQPIDKYGHQPRLYALAVRVGEGQAYDDDILFAGAWLHDLGVFVGHRPAEPEALARWDNVAYACEKAPQLLAEFRFPEEKVAGVVETIRTHQPSGVPTTSEGVILRDADILEQLGAIGILRAVCKIGRDTRYPTFSTVMPVLRKSLAELPGQLRLRTSRLIAESKIEMLEAFLASVERESQGALF